MPVSLDGHHVMLAAYKTAGTYVGLSKAALLTADVSAGATTATVNRNVKVGDYLSFNNGTNREVVRVTGAGTTCTFTPALAYAYQINHDVGHAPRLVADLVEPTGGSPAYARKAMNWLAPANENLTLDPAQKPQFDVAGGHKIGGFAVFSAVTAGTFYGSFLTNSIEGFGAQGTYQLTDADVNLLF